MTKLVYALVVVVAASLCACGQQSTTGGDMPAAGPTAPVDNTPPLDHDNIVSIASRSPDHTKLVAALRAADYVTGVATPGPITVFAPTNAAFDALPAGTVENLLKPEHVDDLRHILQHHVIAATYQASALTDGMDLGMIDGTHCTVHVADGHTLIDNATIVASIPASNGIVHVIDHVLLPPAAH